MYRTVPQVLLLGALCVSVRLPALDAQEPTPATQVNRARIGLVTAGRPITLADVHIVKGMPTGTPPVVAPAANPSSGSGAQGSGALAATPAQPGEFEAQLPATPDSIAARLAANQSCARDKKNQACRVEGSLDLLAADGSPAASYNLHGAWVADLSFNGHRGDTARTGKVTIRYAALEAVPIASSPAATLATVPAASPDSAPVKKHTGIGKFLGKIRQQLAPHIGGSSPAPATTAAQGPSPTGGMQTPSPSTPASAGSASPLASLAHMINTTPGMHHIVVHPPASESASGNPPTEGSYAATVRRQLIAQGADSSRFTVTTAAQASTSSASGATANPSALSTTGPSASKSP